MFLPQKEKKHLKGVWGAFILNVGHLFG